jgi:hypothetical protein
MIMCAQHHNGEKQVQGMIVLFSIVSMALNLPVSLHFLPFACQQLIFVLLSYTDTILLAVIHLLIISNCKM